jgi:carbon-monoxide dehydrogenase large subunit
MVMAGGAVSVACKEIAKRAAKIGAQLLQISAAQVSMRGGEVVGPQGSIALSEIARTWYLKPQNLPSDVDMAGMEATIGYRPNPDTGTFSYATHAALVAVDPEIGGVEILDYVVVEDGGRLVNPMVVDGQILGGLAQGIGTALYEEMPFDASGQPLASTFADYLLPSATEIPRTRIEHMETPSPYTEFGVKGIGEGGAIAAPPSLPTRSTMRCGRSAPSFSFRRLRRIACWRRSHTAGRAKRTGEGSARLRPPRRLLVRLVFGPQRNDVGG